MARTRYFYRRETDEEGVERVFTVAYTHDRDTGATSYGAAVFCQDSPADTFVKASHRHTATERLRIRPVNLTVSAEHPSEVEDVIRESIKTVGVRGKRVAS